MITYSKVLAYYNALDAQKEILVDVQRRVNDSLVSMLSALNTVRGKRTWISVEHEMGIPHTTVDFDDTDEYGIAKGKVFDALSVNPDTGKLELMSETGDILTNFAIDDLAYLVDDVLPEIMELYTSKE